VPALSGERELSAGLCATVSPGQYGDDCEGFHGQRTPAVARWSELIQGYWRRFESHLPTLLRQVGNAFGPVPLRPAAPDFWRQLLQHAGDLAQLTRELIHQFHTCLFGTYRCHQRRPLQAF
jgi:hypothetical protein